MAPAVRPGRLVRKGRLAFLDLLEKKGPKVRPVRLPLVRLARPAPRVLPELPALQVPPARPGQPVCKVHKATKGRKAKTVLHCQDRSVRLDHRAQPARQGLPECRDPWGPTATRETMARRFQVQ